MTFENTIRKETVNTESDSKTLVLLGSLSVYFQSIPSSFNKKGGRQFTSNMHFIKERRKKMPRKKNSLKHDIFVAATKR